MSYDPISVREKLGLLDEHWSPRVIAEMNDYQFKLVNRTSVDSLDNLDTG